MNLRTKKQLAARVLDVSPSKVKFDEERLDDIKEAITKEDIRALIREKVIIKRNLNEQSRSGARKNLVQKRKGRRKNSGSLKGKHTARLGRKEEWIHKVRAQRKLIKELKSKTLIENKIYTTLRNKIKGGFFRSRRHIKLFITEKGLVNDGKK